MTSAIHPHVLLWSIRGSGLHYGGPGMSAYRLYNSSPSKSFKITLAHGHPSQPEYDLFDSQHLIAPVNMQPISQLHFIHKSKKWLNENHTRFHVFHGLGGFDISLEPALHAEKLGLPSFVKLATYKTDLADKPGWKKILARPRRRRHLIRNITGIIAISSQIADELLGYGIPHHKIYKIPNGVDIALFSPIKHPSEKIHARTQLGLPLDAKIILFSGAVNKRKQPHLITESFQEYLSSEPKIHLVLAGPIDDTNYHSTLTAKLPEGAHTSTGFVKDITPYYKAADVFCLPSSNEGMPNALLEAMASGLPCVATNISGSNDLIKNNKHGILTDQTPEAVANAIRNYLTNPPLAAEHAANARQRIENKYSTTEVLKQHLNLFRATAFK